MDIVLPSGSFFIFYGYLDISAVSSFARLFVNGCLGLSLSPLGPSVRDVALCSGVGASSASKLFCRFF